MTRINAGYPPAKLTNKHLIAEHREIKRIPNVVVKGRYNLNTAPKEFTLGTGHVSFFYTRLGYLKQRYVELYNECKRRGFNVQNYEDCWDGVPPELMGDYVPTDQAIQLITERIKDRLENPIAKQKKQTT